MRNYWWNLSAFAFLGTVVVAGPVAVAEETAEKKAGEPALAIKYDDKEREWGGCPLPFPQDHTCSVTVLHGDPAKKNADIFIKIAPDTALGYHKHTSAERMVLLTGQLRVHYDGQAPVVLTPGTYAYGPPELPHTADCIGSEECILFIAFEQPVDAIPVGGSKY